MLRSRLLPLALLASFAPAVLSAQSNQGNWKQAERFSSSTLRPYIYSSTLNPEFLKDSDSFWYLWREADGSRFMFVDPEKKVKRRLFDHVELAAQLSTIHRKPYEPNALPFNTISMSDDGTKFTFVVDAMRYEYDLKTETLKFVEKVEPPRRQTPDYKNTAPDKKAFVYAMESNLYFVEGEKDENASQLSKDGEQYYSFGGGGGFGRQQQEDEEDNSGGNSNQQSSPRKSRANVTWSKDSKAFYISRFDSRKVKELFLVNNLANPRPTLMSYKYSMPGEPDVPQTELWVFIRDSKTFKKIKADKWKDQTISDIHWPEASNRLRFVRRDRLQRNLELCEVDLATDQIKVLLTESVENAYLERQSVRYVKPGGDFIWFSERAGWGHFYLYDHDGNLKNKITSGPWRAESVVALDEKKGLAWIRGVGREANENPYYTHTYQVKLDGTDLRLLNPGDANHSTTFTPSRKFSIDSSSRVDMPTRNVLFDANGKEVMDLEDMDISRLYEMGWKMPETFVVKAADGVTNIYGNMWKPFDFDPKKQYPIILNVYPGPQTESVSYGFSATASTQQLAQLGFIVIQIGNRGGSPQRSNAYHSYGYYNLRDYGLADKKIGVEQLAARHSWIDIDRVGIYGHSGGGFMTAAAMLLPPYNNFFKVGVSSAGNHDNNIYNQNWSEQHHGLKEGTATGQTGQQQGGRTPDEMWLDSIFTPMDAYAFEQNELEAQQNRTGGQGRQNQQDTEQENKSEFQIKVPTTTELAANLNGKLLLVHGDMDNNVHPANTIRLVDALIKANKRFDMMMMPGQAHGFGPMQGYFQNMMFEYFCEHLLGDRYRGSADMNGKG